MWTAEYRDILAELVSKIRKLGDRVTQRFSRRDIRLGSFDEIADAAAGWDIDFRLLARGDGSGEIGMFDTGRALVQRNRLGWKLHQRGASPRGSITFGIGIDATQMFPWCGVEVRGDRILVFPDHGEYESISDKSFHAFSLSFDERLVGAVAERLGAPPDGAAIPEGGVYNVSREEAVSIRATLCRVLDATGGELEEAQESALVEEIEQELLTELMDALVTGRPAERPSRTLRARALKRSKEYIEGSDGGPITVSELCEVAGCSRRTLEYAFKDHFGVSAKAYLRDRRLNAARRELRNPEKARSVRAVAIRWGFWHMSQFAADYRKLFGERPSETVRSAGEGY